MIFLHVELHDQEAAAQDIPGRHERMLAVPQRLEQANHGQAEQRGLAILIWRGLQGTLKTQSVKLCSPPPRTPVPG